MKRVGLTMRVDVHDSIKERRDAIDQRWFHFLEKCYLLPIFLPNNLNYINFIDDLDLDGIILTGGNSLESLGGEAPERDLFEQKILEYMIQNTKPILGVCRGMQIVQNYFGIKLFKVDNHVNKRHPLVFLGHNIEVNSYHNYSATDSIDDLEVLARSEDGIIEAINHKNLSIMGIMWHPEREQTFSDIDINIFRKHFLS